MGWRRESVQCDSRFVLSGHFEGEKPRGELTNQKNTNLIERAIFPFLAGPAKELKPVEIKRFTNEAREALEKEGYVIYGLKGESIKSQRDAQRPFWSTWHHRYPDFEALPSMCSEVAINPQELFLRRSKNKNLRQQEALVEKFSQDLAIQVSGVAAVIGQAADYIDLTFQHLDATQDCLFGKKYGYNYARTKTPTSRSAVAIVGDFGADYGLDIYSWPTGNGNAHVYAAPLVIPIRWD